MFTMALEIDYNYAHEPKIWKFPVGFKEDIIYLPNIGLLIPEAKSKLNEIIKMHPEQEGIVKLVEGRVPRASKNPFKATSKTNYSKIEIGDIAEFSAYDRPDLGSALYFIADVEHFPVPVGRNAEFVVRNFINRFRTHTLCSPSCKTEDDAIQEYLSFKGYPERIEQFGIYAIMIGALINPDKNIYK